MFAGPQRRSTGTRVSRLRRPLKSQAMGLTAVLCALAMKHLLVGEAIVILPTMLSAFV